jgi:deoxycytidylate deaminase
MVSEEPNLLPAVEAAKNSQEDNSHVGLGQTFADTELVFGLVGAVGTELKKVVDILEERLKVAKYDVKEVRISQAIIPQLVPKRKTKPKNEYERISNGMDDGDTARETSGDNSVLALGAASWISSLRKKDAAKRPQPAPRTAYIINSLKHPEEVYRLREIYPLGFYLIGVHADQERRFHYLCEEGLMTKKQARGLMERDEKEKWKYGQHLTDTFHLSDFFVRIDGDQDRLKNSLWRFLEIVFGDPYKTPTFDEYAMFSAFVNSLRSSALSRQVGAVVAQNNEIVSTGTNDSPQFGGGLYWPEYKEESKKIEDMPQGRDYTRKKDANKAELAEMINGIIRLGAEKGIDKVLLRETLEASSITDLTEFGRAVHAEMEAVLACGRHSVSAEGGTLYCTTFPCHNCAKHIIAAGIHRVVYIEPYEKSKAEKLHSDAMVVGFKKKKNAVRFEPFVGLGPRRFLDLFSMRLGSGYFLKRKNEKDKTLDWKINQSRARLQMLPKSYLDLEFIASDMFNQFRQKEKENGIKENLGGN